MINTYNLIVYFNGYEREYNNISRVAVKRFIDWHRQNPDFYGYAVDDLFSIDIDD